MHLLTFCSASATITDHRLRLLAKWQRHLGKVNSSINQRYFGSSNKMFIAHDLLFSLVKYLTPALCCGLTKNFISLASKATSPLSINREMQIRDSHSYWRNVREIWAGPTKRTPFSYTTKFVQKKLFIKGLRSRTRL